jgi:glutamate-1-semialdehyde 2,1-aminomutase
MSTISLRELEKEYVKKHSKSNILYERALKCFSGGVTHDARYAKPFPIYAVRAKRTKKWDVDGNEYIDYVMGHGALLLGYGDERIERAFQEQISRAVHMGSCTELEIEWAELIQKLVPCARGGWVRAAACGTEAIQMAIRLARAYTGRDKILLHAGSYHGTQDNTVIASRGPPYGICNIRGIPQGAKKDALIIPYNDLCKVEEKLETEEVACIILQGNAPFAADYIKGLRELTTEYGVAFILDEVVSGFRYAAGGAQEYYGIIPDIAVLGKIIGGGAPIGAICGKKEILDLYSFKDDYWNRFVRVSTGGTWNAQPISIVGGIAMMKIIDAERDTLYPRLYNVGKRISKTFNEQAEDLGVSALACGLPIDNPTIIKLNFLNRPVPPDKLCLWEAGPSSFEDCDIKASFLAGEQATYANYLSITNDGIFAYRGDSFKASAKHTEEDLQKTESALGKSLRTLKENHLIGNQKT